MNETRPTRVRRRRARRGFTLMEVLLVLAILVILGTLVGTNFTGMFANAKISAAKAQISALEKPMELYMMDVGTYPSTQQGLQALRTQPTDLADPTKWLGPYLQKDIPADPWGNQYGYELMPGGRQFRIFSVGPDGALNTADDLQSVSG
jgi:general secretion pathway protein G